MRKIYVRAHATSSVVEDCKMLLTLEGANIKRIGNLYQEIYSFENLFEAFLMARKKKKDRREVLEFTANLEENLIELQNELIHRTYKVGEYYEFFVNEPKRRMVMALPFRDRVVQWAIYRVVNPIFESQFYEHSYACRVGKGTHSAANKLQKWLKIVEKRPEKYYYLKMDISKYFYRVDHEILIKMIRKRVKDEEVLSLLTLIIKSEDTDFGLPVGSSLIEVTDRESDTGMPIGNLTSQMFANIYLNELDKFVKHALKTHFYARYMDDFIILSDDKSELHDFKNQIIVFLDDELRLQTNNKTCVRPIALGIEFVGYKIWATHKKIRKSTTKRVRKKLRFTQKQYARGEITAEKVSQTVQSCFAVFDNADSKLLKEKFSKTYVFTKG